MATGTHMVMGQKRVGLGVAGLCIWLTPQSFQASFLLGSSPASFVLHNWFLGLALAVVLNQDPQDPLSGMDLDSSPVRHLFIA